MTPAERERALAALRAPRPVPTVLQPARLAHPGEIPTPARQLLDARVEPWRARALHALGPLPYSWSEPGHRHDGGHRLVAAVLVQLRHPDGRAAAAVWTSDKLATKLGAKLPAGVEGPRLAPEVVGQTFGFAFGYRWRVCTCPVRPGEHPAAIPVPISARDLRKAIAVPDHVAPPVTTSPKAA